ncbi:SID1 transmembrane family member 1-like isoform X2 [Dendronephthya gigantea]|uniref:SID1 transmembrane family member 1-like isoform X2 n=1 Tax=Dendronephthya gigantea TaxID=151771 RepID=UPI001069AD61|nr:SID1 transmembrane family member 1-like isoform X2 [Dendronephthya gigantea]
MKFTLCGQLYVLFALFWIVKANFKRRSPCFANYHNGTFGSQTNGTVSVSKEDIYNFHYIDHLRNDTAVIVQVNSNASHNFPLLVVIQQQKGVLSWTIPFSGQEKSTYETTSHVLCPDNQFIKTNMTNPFFWVSLSSSSPSVVAYSLYPKLLDNFMLNLDHSQTVYASPSEPMINAFEFSKDVDTVLVKAESRMSACSILSVQGTKCPIFDLERNVEFTGNFQTMRYKSGIVVKKDDFPSYKFYIVTVVLVDNERCKSGKNNKNPFRNDDIFRGSSSVDHGLKKNNVKNDRKKSVTLKIVKIPSENEYTKAIVIPILVFSFGFYVPSALYILYQYKNGARKLSVPSQDILEDEDEGIMPEGGGTISNYGTTERGNVTTTSAQSQTSELNDMQTIQQSIDDGSQVDGEFDFLHDIEEDKEIYRLKKDLCLSDLSKKKRKRLQKKYSLYCWNLIIIAVFYALPVVQLVFTYQRVLNASGDQDICYYNFYCSRPLGPVSSFNNVYSNIGYVMLGILFFLLVWRRDLQHQRESVNDEHLGIPQHYGIFYALALSLIMEGILSACYHVCPSYTNFQFDTSFMYIIACLIIVQLYSTRHPDLAAKPHIVFGTFAAIILVAVSGVVFTSFAFWTIFCFVLITFSVYSTTQMYYMGRIRLSFSEIKRSFIFLKHDIFSCPVYKDRMVLLLLANLVNWGLAINGMATEPKDFASYLLAILIVNGLIYLLFYVVMKIRNGEKIFLISILCSLLTLICWTGSLVFFLQGLTSWQTVTGVIPLTQWRAGKGINRWQKLFIA